MNRGRRKERIFKNESDFSGFISLLKEMDRSVLVLVGGSFRPEKAWECHNRIGQTRRDVSGEQNVEIKGRQGRDAHQDPSTVDLIII
jgi:hypothetical protein